MTRDEFIARWRAADALDDDDEAQRDAMLALFVDALFADDAMARVRAAGDLGGLEEPLPSTRGLIPFTDDELTAERRRTRRMERAEYERTMRFIATIEAARRESAAARAERDEARGDLQRLRAALERLPPEEVAARVSEAAQEALARRDAPAFVMRLDQLNATIAKLEAERDEALAALARCQAERAEERRAGRCPIFWSALVGGAPMRVRCGLLAGHEGAHTVGP